MKLPGKGMSWKEFSRALRRGWSEDQLSTSAAALAYSGMLALFPFLLFLIAVGSFAIRPDQVESLVAQLQGMAPPDVVRLVGQQAVNITYRVREGRPFWKVRGIAVLATIVVALLILLAAVIVIAAAPVADAIGGPIGTLILWLRWPVSGLIMMFVWAVLYYLLPDVEQRFKFITPGSVAGVIIWLVASWGFAEYVTHFGKYNATYGALGGAVVLLLWMYIASLVFVLGAEINAIIEHESPDGKRLGAKRRSDTGATRRSTEPAPSTGVRRPGEPAPATSSARVAPQARSPGAVPIAPGQDGSVAGASSRGRLGFAGAFAFALGLAAGLVSALRRPAEA